MRVDYLTQVLNQNILQCGRVALCQFHRYPYTTECNFNPYTGIESIDQYHRLSSQVTQHVITIHKL